TGVQTCALPSYRGLRLLAGRARRLRGPSEGRGMKGELVVVGVSHRSAPVELRERLSLTLRELGPELEAALGDASLREAMLISTCNRVELYAAVDDPVEGAPAARAFLERRANEPLEGLTYRRTGAEAARHAFRVAASLDSLVVGEPQILGQVK